MKIIKMQSRAGSDGILKLRIPVEKNRKFDVVIVVQPVAEEAESNGWSSGFLNTVVGGWQGSKLTRPARGRFETRTDLI